MCHEGGDCFPDTQTYELLISVFCKLDCGDLATKLFEEMKENRLQPTPKREREREVGRAEEREIAREGGREREREGGRERERGRAGERGQERERGREGGRGRDGGRERGRERGREGGREGGTRERARDTKKPSLLAFLPQSAATIPGNHLSSPYGTIGYVMEK